MSKKFNNCTCCNHPLSDTHKNQEWIYWNFETKTWDKCRVVKKLPYDIGMFEFIETKVGKFVAPMDSYRLYYANAENAVSNNAMDSERKWREAACKEGTELDIHIKDKWVKGYVHGLKSDIVEWVFRVAHRKSSNVIGYIHMDSRSLAPESTHTHKFTEQELMAETEAEDKAAAERHQMKIQINKIVDTIPLHDMCHIAEIPSFISIAVKPIRSQPNTKYRDYSRWFQTLKIHPDDASVVDFKKYNDGKEIKDIPTPGLLLLVAESKNGYNVAWESVVTDHRDYTTITGGDFYTDIRVDGPKEAEYTIEYGDIELGRIHGGETFEFDIKNPLVQTVQSSLYAIRSTIPGRISYKCYYMDPKERSVIYGEHNPPFYVLRIPALKKYAFLGHIWQPSGEFPMTSLMYNKENNK